MLRKLIFTLLIPVLFAACYSSKQSSPMKRSFISNKVIAHRGAWKNTGTPQNSVASLEAAFKLGCEGTEFDIRMTADSVIILNHDADHQGLEIEKTSYADLQLKPLKNGEPLPTLETIIKKGLAQNKTKLIAEIKTSPAGKERSIYLAEKVVEMVHRLKARQHTIYISFDYDVCKRIRQMDKGAPVQYLNGARSPEQLKADGLDADYHFNVIRKDPEWIAKAHAAGIVVNAWTVNDTLMMDSFLQQGIDYITTDEPELLLQRPLIRQFVSQQK